MPEFIYKRHYINATEKVEQTLDYETPIFLFFYEAIDYWETRPTMHNHLFTEIFYIMDGDGVMFYNDKVVPLKKNELHIIPKGVEHCEAGVQNGKPLKFFVINVDNNFPFYKTKHTPVMGDEPIRYVFKDENNDVLHIYKKILQDVNADPQPRQCSHGIDLLISQLDLEIGRLFPPAVTEQKQSENNISVVLAYIIEHFAEDISLETLADLLHVSTVQLGKLFKKAYNMTPMEFLANERIFHAKQMLRNSDAPVTDISLKVGYNSPAYFTSVFRKAVGKTPSEYRRVLGYERF